MTVEQIKNATGATLATAQKMMPYLVDTCTRYGITSPISQLCFLAQIGHESGGLFYTEELASGKAYEGRKDLGNTVKGDGVRFKGRGLIQITGRANYKIVSKALGKDFINQPYLLGGKNVKMCTHQQLVNATDSAAWFWNSKKLSIFADMIEIDEPMKGRNLELFTIITKRINGGVNGLADRVAKYNKGLPFFLKKEEICQESSTQ